MKLKYIIPIFTLSIIFLSCNKDDDATDNFDAAAQALIDDTTLIEYLKTHYYIPAAQEKPFGTIDTILNNETSLFDDDRLETQNISHEDISYKLYYLAVNQGVNENPTRYDSVFVKYRGFLLDSTKFDENVNFLTLRGWQNMSGGIFNGAISTGVIQGWKYGMPYFKSGVNITMPNDPITYEDTGVGVLFFPSGLAYGNRGTGGIPSNEPLLFHIELAQVIEADNDNDGAINKYEDLNEDGEVTDDDTDGDGFPNFVDPDDDDDGVLTRDEDVDGDGNPVNDDTDNDEIPNYLDPDDDNDGILTKDEDANEDGDPTNDDTDGDGTPDYLDADS
ncbi:MAG: hypothetical protein L3J20_00045 [Flavobacteriaceae bacterium]|nr:hypothetical protein [Flavobacteriaceae bacterium]